MKLAERILNRVIKKEICEVKKADFIERVKNEIKIKGKGSIQVSEKEGQRLTKELGAVIPPRGKSGDITVDGKKVGTASDFSGITIKDLSWALKNVEPEGAMWFVNFGSAPRNESTNEAKDLPWSKLESKFAKDFEKLMDGDFDKAKQFGFDLSGAVRLLKGGDGPTNKSTIRNLTDLIEKLGDDMDNVTEWDD